MMFYICISTMYVDTESTSQIARLIKGEINDNFPSITVKKL